MHGVKGHSWYWEVGYARNSQDRYGVGSHVGVLDKTTKWGANMYMRGRAYVG